jgi:ankyrin repeat protein
MKAFLPILFSTVLLAGCGSSQGESLVQAAEQGNIEAVKQHLAGGVDVNATNMVGETVLHKSSAKGHREVVKLLIANGAKVNVQNRNGWTPLHHVTWRGYGDLAKLFVAKGADVNAKTKYGGTPLLNAALKGYREIAELLIANGAEVNALVNGATPLDLAIEHGHDGIAGFLIKHGGRTARELE